MWALVVSVEMTSTVSWLKLRKVRLSMHALLHCQQKCLQFGMSKVMREMCLLVVVVTLKSGLLECSVISC